MAQAKAILRNTPTSPRKMRYVIDTVRGLDVEKAFNTLHFSTKHPARVVEKLLRSAVNNWKQANPGLREEDSALFVKEIFADAGTTIKRFLPAPHGRAYKMRKRSNHVTIIVDSRNGAGNDAAVESTEELEATPAVVAVAEETAVETKPKRTRKPAAEKADKPAKKTTKKSTKA